MGATGQDSLNGNGIAIFEVATESEQYSTASIPDGLIETPEIRQAALRAIKKVIVNALSERCVFHILQLSMRSQAILQQYGMVTIGALIEKSKDELLSTPGFSRIMVRELEGELSHWGLVLAPSVKRRR